MKSIDQILKLSRNKHYHLKVRELALLDEIAEQEFDSSFAELNEEQREMLDIKYGCACGSKK